MGKNEYKQAFCTHRSRAFSLVELSIVLVILGLLTGGILAGQSLIRAAELRAVVAEYQRYTIAIRTFREKYMALPGDMRNATSFWGDDATNCADAAIANGTPGTCNGNGDGLWTPPAGASVTGETFQSWKQLALAGLIEGSYSGLAGTGGYNSPVIGTNLPRSRINNAGWSTYYTNTPTGTSITFVADYGNHLIFGADETGNNMTTGKILKTDETWSIDTKLDDGKPGYGNMIATNWDECTDAADATSVNSNYDLSSTSIACSFRVRKLF